MRVEQVEHRRRHLGIGAVVDRHRDLAARSRAAAGRRVQLLPSQRERGQRPPAVSSDVVGGDGAERPRPRAGTATRGDGGAGVAGDVAVT